MLVLYAENFNLEQLSLLASWGSVVKCWPRTWLAENQIGDWWMEFEHDGLMDIWLLKYPENSRIMRTLFD